MKKNIIYWVSFLCIVISCISPYEPKNIESTEGLLVVEANLLAPYGSEVKLSRTVSLENFSHYSSYMPYMPVSGEVKIVSDDGEEYRMTETVVNGTFVLDQEFVYRENVKYALEILSGGKYYRSEYITPLQTPEVDALRWVYNEKYDRGNHTTTLASMITVSSDTRIIDTPGIRRFVPSGIDAADLIVHMREFAPLAGKCVYGLSCSHRSEPGCKIMEAVHAGVIHEDRYTSFLRIHDELSGKNNAD